MKKTNILTIFLFVVLAFNSNGQPVITSFTPASGAVGTSVTIIGSNFSAVPANNIVYFGAVKAVVNTASVSSLNVTVPVDASYQFITVTTNNLTAYSFQPFNVTFQCFGAIDSSSFSGHIDYTTGTDPRRISIGDLDGDGKSDLAVANHIGQTISVFKSTSTSGTISFSPKVDYTPGGAPSCVTIGDLDGDGKPELVTANNNSNDNVSVFKNTSTIGAVSFAARVDFIAGTYPYLVSIGDLDGDGKPDLAVVNYSNNTVSILRNTTSGGIISFAAKVDYITGSSPNSISIGDLDGDGKPDLSIANRSSNTVSVLKNLSTNGTISFAPKVDYITGTSPCGASIADLDGDGKFDLIIPNLGSNTLSIFRNTSISGTISFASKVDFSGGAGSSNISTGDLNGDGKPDIAVTNYNANSISIFKNTSTIGAISFSPKTDFPASGSANPACVSIGDLDGDGKPDLAVASEGASSSGTSISILKNQVTCASSSPADARFTSSQPGCTGQLENFYSVMAGVSGITHSWSFGSGAAPASSALENPTGIVYSIMGAKIVTHIVTAGSNSDTVINIITINPSPAASFISSAPACSGNIVNFSNSGSTGPGVTYSWDFGSGASPNTSTSLNPNGIIYNTAGTKTVSLSISNEFECVTSTTQTITINPLPLISLFPFTAVCMQAVPFALTGGLPTGGTYSGTAVDSLGVFHPGSANAIQTIFYTITNSFNCSNMLSQNITVHDCTGIDENNVLPEITIYPNPANGIFNIAVKNSGSNELQIGIFDMQGKEVFNTLYKNTGADFNKQISLETLAKGIYYVKLNTRLNSQIQKLIIQ